MNVAFGIKTTPMHVDYADILRVWQEADGVPEIQDAWLWDHLLPLAGPKDGPILEGWTLLSALAARTERLRLGLLVTSNPIRPPAVLGKIATTVDVISGGRLVMGLGVGGTRQPLVENPAVAEFAAYGLPLVSPGEGVTRLVETIEILRRMWREDTFDFSGPHTSLRGTINSPKPLQPGGPPLLIGGWGDRTLRVVASSADIWNIPGPPHNSVAYIADRMRALDEACAAMGRAPGEITRSVQIIIPYDDVPGTRETVRSLIAVGMTHIVLSLRPPYPVGVARWLADEIITPIRTNA